MDNPAKTVPNGGGRIAMSGNSTVRSLATRR